MKAKSPIDVFFNMGNKVTKGDPLRTANFNYAMLWLMFAAFFSIFLTSLFNFFSLIGHDTWNALRSFGWAGVMVAILWFQYQGLTAQRNARKQLMELYKNKPKDVPKNLPIEEDSVKDMLNQFKTEEKVNGA